jgi:IS1 family transposase
MSWWPFPPSTREVQFDEEWAFVGKKQRNCDPADPADDHCGDYWDYVAYDPEHRLVLVVIPGARTEENGRALVAEVEERTGGGPPELMTSDEYPVYAGAIRETYGEPVPAERKPGRPRVVPERRVPEGVVYATVHKHRVKGRVVAVEPRLVFGSQDELDEA